MLKEQIKSLKNFNNNSEDTRKLDGMYFGTSDGHQKKFATLPLQLH